jgi:alpha-tubulin suppressor-like RCC1 family protein
LGVPASKAVSTGQNITCGIEAGALYCWGFEENGSLPFGGSTRSIELPTPVALEAAALVGVSVDTFGGCTWTQSELGFCWSRNDEGQLGVGDFSTRVTAARVPGVGWTELVAARFSTCGVRNGTAYCAGQNASGQLGQGHLDDINTFRELPLPPE